jgi:DNA-directed RNA polymerase specialized sigma24 family protein
MDESSQRKILDRSEVDGIYRRYAGLVLRRARRILGDDQLAHDVCQDVFVQLVRSQATWTSPSAVGWLYRTTTNCCLRRLPPPQSLTPPLSTQLVLRGIPERLHEIAIYYGLDEMSQEEIALVLGLSQKTVSNRLRELRSWLSDVDAPSALRNP